MCLVAAIELFLVLSGGSGCQVSHMPQTFVLCSFIKWCVEECLRLAGRSSNSCTSGVPGHSQKDIEGLPEKHNSIVTSRLPDVCNNWLLEPVAVLL